MQSQKSQAAGSGAGADCCGGAGSVADAGSGVGAGSSQGASSNACSGSKRGASNGAGAYKDVGSGSCVGAGCNGGAGSSADYYRNKMECTLQILRNREETLRVQSESLRAAEERLADAARSDRLLRERLYCLQQELDKLRRQTAARAEAAAFQQAADAGAVAAELAGARADFDIVGSLYRNCFYEVTKQQNTIELLRKSYLDIRSMDDQKCRRIGELQQELESQPWSLDKCQDLAVEVENLKTEIMSYLNSPNNDSGVWERCEDPSAAEVAEDLQEILHQLFTLRDILTSDCTCGLAAENERLREEKVELQTQMSQLRQKIVASEAALSEHACCIRRLEDQITLKRQQVCQLRSQFTAREEALRAAPAPDAVDVLRNQLQSAQECVKAKTEELEKLREECGAHDATIKRLEEQLRQAKVVQENSEVCSDVSQLSEQVRSWRAQLADSASRVYALEGQLDAARRRCRRYELSYREEAECAARLQAELAEATERGAELCEEARRLASALRGWARRLRDTHVDQQRRLREQETELHQLRQRLLAAPVTRSQSCSRSELAPTRASQRTTKIGFDQRCGRRAMDARSCSSSPASRFTSASASPLICRRQTRHSNVPSLPRGESPAEVLMSRVEHLSAALDSGRQRWARASPRPHTSR